MHSILNHFFGKRGARHDDVPFFLGLLVIVGMAAMVVAGVKAQGAPVILSGPFVSEATLTENSAVVQWNTDRESTSVVYYGLTPSLEKSPYRKIVPISEDTVMESSHSMTLWELQSGATYYYRVSSEADGVAAESAVNTFKTRAATPEPVIEVLPEIELIEPEKPTIDNTETEPVEIPIVRPEPKPVVKPPVLPVAEKPQLLTPTPTPAPTPVLTVPVEKTAETTAETLLETENTLSTAMIEEVGLLLTGVSQALNIDEFFTAPSAPEVGSGAPAVPVETVPLECAQGGISAERCGAWMEAKFADRSCAANGLQTRESCEIYLTEGNNGVFPGCEGKTAEECFRVRALTLIGYLPKSVQDQANEVVSKLIDSKQVVSIAGLTPIRAEDVEGVSWWKSSSEGDQETSVGVLVRDTDNDQLPDDFELARGIDPNRADTDGDGVADGDELKAGTNPLGAGEAAVALTAQEEVIVFHKPLGQPLGAGTFNDSFDVKAAAASAVGDEKSKSMVLSGRCAPQATCIIYIYSYIPMVLTTVADENGNFSYDLANNIVDGEHTVYVAVTDGEGKVKEKSNPLSFFVKEAQAVTAENFLAADVAQAATVNVEEQTLAVERRNYLYAIVPIAAVGLAALWFFLRKRPTTTI